LQYTDCFVSPAPSIMICGR